MTTNGDLSPRQPDEHEPLKHARGDALDRVDETVENITDDQVEEHLAPGARRIGVPRPSS